MAGDLDWHDFFSLSFSHHDEILSKTKTISERVFYIHQIPRATYFFLSPHPFKYFFPKTLEVTRKSRIFAQEKLHSAN